MFEINVINNNKSWINDWKAVDVECNVITVIDLHVLYYAETKPGYQAEN